jgi:hypothetical protein
MNFENYQNVPQAGIPNGAISGLVQAQIRKESAVEMSFSNLEVQQKCLAEEIALLNDKLTPVLNVDGQPNQAKDNPTRPRHSAPLAEAIQQQAEVLGRGVAMLREIRERLAV